MKLKASFVIPAFNAESYLAQAILSCRGQSVKEIEILVVDNGSTDGTRELVEWHAKQDKRVKLLITSNNSTWSSIDLTSLAPVDYTVSTPTSFVHPFTGEFYVYLMGQNNRVYEIHYNLSTWTRASLKHAPPPTTFKCEGHRAVEVWPFNDDLRQAPFGRPHTPSRIRSLRRARQRTSPRRLNTRTASPSAIPRAPASAGWSVTHSSG